MKKYNAEELIRKHLAGNCTPEEKALVESWHLKDLADSTYLPDKEQVDAVHQRMQLALSEHIRTSGRRPVIKQLWFRATAAALVAGIITTSVYLYVTSSHDDRSAPPALSAIQPGHNGAILTLADGKTVVLDSMGNGLLTMQNGTKLLLNNGQLKYQATSDNNTTIAYNTISTTRGRQFRVTLPDGSQVWLNAASSITYPVSFTGNERAVTVTGETYFEVAHSNIPFKVKKRNTEVEVLGTHFNVNAYDDEPDMKVTLLEGSVKVLSMEKGESAYAKASADKSAMLKPGQQAILSGVEGTANHKLQTTSNVDIEQVIAWKNDVFNFQDATLEQVMRQMSRWYDIEIQYEKGIPDIAFEGAMSRQNKLSDVLHSLEGLGVHFRLEGRRLVVLP